ncbi:hypothetical protein HZH66_001426 [Vespula vulgaris]|uniref:Uncharacterized protein n=1 Tax=Vespula vulgaris TaxID=7454 RepID=A0A834NJJ4_VESVU|nr:hypothetical protein HZH66_001426 [Vespula vulgaris]
MLLRLLVSRSRVVSARKSPRPAGNGSVYLLWSFTSGNDLTLQAIIDNQRVSNNNVGVAFVSDANQMIGISKDKVRHASRKDDDKDQLDRNHRQEYQQIQQYRGKEIAT